MADADVPVRTVHLANAPITEAILDIRVKARKDLAADSLRDLAASFAPEFPTVEERRGFQVVFEAGDVAPSQSTIDLGVQSVFLKSSDAKTLLHVRVDGFSLHRLKPYVSWEALFPTFLQSWADYRDFTNPESIVRFGVRYLNHITLPADLVDFDDYLRSGPQLPAGVPPYISGFLTQVVVSHPDWGVEAAVRQSLEQDFKTGRSTVLLDIDAYDAGVQDAVADVSATFATLREYKNLLFFGSLTDQTLELFR